MIFPLLCLCLITAWLAWRCAHKNKPAPISGLSSRNRIEDSGHGLDAEDGRRPGAFVIGETRDAEASLVSSLQQSGHNNNVLSLGDPILQAFDRGIQTV